MSEDFTRSNEHVLRQCVHAVACCVDHYAEERLSHDGLRAVYAALREVITHSQTGLAFTELYQYEDTPPVEFADRIQWPEGWEPLENEVDAAIAGDVE